MPKAKLTKANPDLHPDSICWRYAERFRVRLDELGDPVIELTGSKGQRQFVYDYASDTFGVWLESGKPMQTFNRIKARFQSVSLEQEGDGEITFTFKPQSESEGVKFLTLLKCERKQTRNMPEEQKQASRERLQKMWQARKATVLRHWALTQAKCLREDINERGFRFHREVYPPLGSVS